MHLHLRCQLKVKPLSFFYDSRLYFFHLTLFLSRQGGMYCWLHQIRATLHDRTLEVISVDTDSITVRFWPEGKQVVIHLNETVKVQVAYDATPDVIMTLMQLNADGSVLLRVRFPEQKQLAEAAKGQGDVFTATVIGMAASTLLVCVFIDYWVLPQQKLPPKDWWLANHHEPF